MARPIALQVAAGLLPSLAVNLLSAKLELPFAVTVALVLASIVLLVLTTSAFPWRAGGQRPTAVELEALALAQFALVSVLAGGLVAGVSLVPFGTARLIDLDSMGIFTNYELLAIGILTTMASASAIRRRRPVWWLTFIAAAVTGCTVVFQQFRPDVELPWGYGPAPMDPAITLLGWTAAASVVTLVIANFGRGLALFGFFWGFGGSFDSAHISVQPEQVNQETWEDSAAVAAKVVEDAAHDGPMLLSGDGPALDNEPAGEPRSS